MQTETTQRSNITHKVSDAQIYLAVSACINQIGSTKFTMSQVAEQAGLTRVQVHNRFGSKNALILRFLVDHASEFKAQVSQQLRQSKNLVLAIENALLAGIRKVENDPHFRMLVMQAVTNQDEEGNSAIAVLALGRDQWIPALERGVAEGNLELGLSITETADWLTLSEITLLNAVQNYGKTLKQCRAYVRQLVLPPLVSQ